MTQGMINIEQIQALEKKINNAVELINILKRENTALKKTIVSSKTRMEELENLVNQFKNEQFEIEKGILNALTKLDELEDDITEVSPREKESGSEESKSGKSESDQPELIENQGTSDTLIEESFEDEDVGESNELTKNNLAETEIDDDLSSVSEDNEENELDIF